MNAKYDTDPRVNLDIQFRKNARRCMSQYRNSFAESLTSPDDFSTVSSPETCKPSRIDKRKTT